MTLTNYQLWRNGRSDVEMIRTPRDPHRLMEPATFGPVGAINLTRLGGSPIGRSYDPDFPGDIAEVLIYDKALTAQERGMVEAYLMDRYKID